MDFRRALLIAVAIGILVGLVGIAAADRQRIAHGAGFDQVTVVQSVSQVAPPGCVFKVIDGKRILICQFDIPKKQEVRRSFEQRLTLPRGSSFWYGD